MRPAYRQARPREARGAPEAVAWIEFAGGIHQVGHDGKGFAWDNEAPRHDVLIHPFRLADRLVTCGEWLDFMADGGYRTAALWLSDGWATVNREGWQAPLYWEERDGAWLAMSLEGLQPVDRASPVAHVSYYEADAFARWAGKRLPTEFEWEVAARDVAVAGNTLATRALRPQPPDAPADGRPRQMFGDVWEWTQSAYLPYPGYRPPAGALGEYNGKFMVSQQVLRGGSCATPAGPHARHLSQLLLSPPALAVHGPAPRHGDRVMSSRNMRELLSERFALVDDEFATAVLDGLSRPQKTLPCRFFYDARGSELFEEITRLPEYYPTRTEPAILRAHAAEMADGIARGRRSRRVRLRLEPQDRGPARQAAAPGGLCRHRRLARAPCATPGSASRPASPGSTCARWSATSPFRWPCPADLAGRPKTGFFPGSTIGNLTPAEAQRLLRVFRELLSPGGRLIVGVDLKKDVRKLVLAYNDAAGVTAAFNLNLLARINREIGGTFDLDAFRHEAIYNPRDGRIEMHLVSRRDQDATHRRPPLPLPHGESIHTENSYKYTVRQFQGVARAAGWTPTRVWTDPSNLFSVHELVTR